MNDLTDEELVSAFLEAVRGLSGREVESRVPGVTQSDVSRWTRRKFSALSSAKRRALIDYLEKSRGTTRRPVLFRPTINYAGLQIDLAGVDRLTPRALVEFNRLMLALIASGHDRAALERAGGAMLAPIVQAGIDDEADQVATLRALEPVAHRVAGGVPATASVADVGAEETLDVLQQLEEAREDPRGSEGSRGARGGQRRTG